MILPESLQLELKPAGFLLLAPLLGQGVGIPIAQPLPLDSFLLDTLECSAAFIENELQTILVDGRAVDRVAQVWLADQSVVALSAAMPGLVGTTLRRGGHLAAMRQAITATRDGHAPDTAGAGMVTVKLFNLVARQLGPKLMRQGCILPGMHVADCIDFLLAADSRLIVHASRNGHARAPQELAKEGRCGDRWFVKIVGAPRRD